MNPVYRLPLLLCLAVFFLAGCGGNDQPPSTSTKTMLADACRYLWQAQSADGGWHSTTHGILKGGQAWTPFVLYALLAVPDSISKAPPERVALALDFLRRHIDTNGALGLYDPVVIEYPNYATAYALRVFIRYGVESDSHLVRRMRAYLVGQQFTEHRGFTEDSLVYGGWGFGETDLAHGRFGHVDLSHTRRILQALREAQDVPEEAFKKAGIFLRLLQKHPTETRSQPALNNTAPPCRNYDGGFYSSPVIGVANKGGETDSCSSFRSYATATCDGILALLAAGYSPEDEPVRSGLTWLQQNASLEFPEGIPEDNPNQWHKVMFFYHLAVRSEVYARTGWPEKGGEKLRALLAERQQPDGSFSNPMGTLNKEDDPLLATALAVIALHYGL